MSKDIHIYSYIFFPKQESVNPSITTKNHSTAAIQQQQKNQNSNKIINRAKTNH